MDSIRDRGWCRCAAVCLFGAVLGASAACDRAGREPADETSAAAIDDEPSGATDAELAAACDSVGMWLRETVAAEFEETRGPYTGSVHAASRHGCRFQAADTLDAEAPQRSLDRVWYILAEHGWSTEEAYTAEATEGRMAGMRRGSILCVLQHYWDIGSDDERAADWLGAVPYHVRVECFRDAPRPPPP